MTIWLFMIAVGLVAALFLLVFLAWTTSWGIKPIRSLTGQIEQIEEPDLSDRLSLEGGGEELIPIVRCLNGLLERLQSAFSREKSFTGGRTRHAP